MELPKTTFTLLILDDNQIDREVCRRYLAKSATNEFVFFEHNTIDGALEKVEEKKPDCILLDYHLTDGTGIEFLSRLQDVGGTKRYPVVMLTGTGSEAIAVQVMKAGAQDYLVKDRLSSDLLQRTVETAIYKAQTERLLDEQRLEMERLFREAQEANTRKDQFLAALSHELRTPLTPVLAAITATDVYKTPPEQMQEIFQIIRRNIELEARLIDDMLDLTRISRGKLEVNLRPVDLHGALQHAAHACEEERAVKDISIRWELDAEHAVIVADSARIQQVFWNVLKNALKFTPSGGSVTVSTRDMEEGIEIAISDNGTGLQPHLIGKIFDAFEQGSSEITRRFGGLGLGLAISKALVDAHGGSIRAENNPQGTGAKFTIVLPSKRGGAVQPTDISASEAHSLTNNSKGHRVLLVEDHADSAFFIKHMLETIGYETVLAENITKALKIFQTQEVDCIVSDLGLPDGQGTELMEKVATIRAVPAIALSGYGMEADVDRSLAAGFSRHLTKPVDLKKLESTLTSLLKDHDQRDSR